VAVAPPGIKTSSRRSAKILPLCSSCDDVVVKTWSATGDVFRQRFLQWVGQRLGTGAVPVGPVLGVIVLSGMGNDGTAGAACLSRNGGKVIVQDAETCVVWGMPGAVAKAGLADAILSPGSMTRLLGQAVKL